MKSISKILVIIIVLLSITASYAQNVKNAKTESVKIYGNCGMCKTTIEKTGNLKKIAKVDWNKDTKMATITYNEKKTNQDEILKRIALAGYDSEKFLAPNDVYSNLHGCCQYERKAQTVAKAETPKMEVKEDHSTHTMPMEAKAETPKMEVKEDHSTHTMPMEAKEVNQLTAVFDNYFALKDALVQTNGTVASEKSKSLLAALNAVKMDKLAMDVHMVWMKVMKDLKFDAEYIEETKDPAHQRDHFTSLSKNMYALMKVAKYEQPVYYQFCPMANDSKGANWLSKENAVKNPYYGSQMMTCGKVVETIK